MGQEHLQVTEHASTPSEATEPAAVAPPAPEMPAAVAHVPAAMTVGSADDAAESAADRMADDALSRLGAAHPPLPDGPAAAGPVRRSVVPGGGSEGGALDDQTASRIASSRGRPLDEPVRRRMEGAFGRSFSAVRLHDDAGAADLSSSISAQAFTTGNDVFLGAGVDPSTGGGERVLAHELAHVVQNRGGAPIHRLFGFGKKKEAPKVEAPKIVEAPQDAPEVPDDVAKDTPEPGEKAKPVTPKPAAGEGFHEDIRKALDAAKISTKLNYEAVGRYTNAWVPKKQQKEIADVSSWSKRAGGDTDKRTLKDLVRAYVLAQYIQVLLTKVGDPVDAAKDTPRALTEAERASIDGKYFPKTLRNRDKWKGLIDLGPYAPESQTFLADAGFAGAIARTPEEKAEDGGGPKIDVRSTFIGSDILGAPRRMHLFLVYTSSEGEQTYLRGGPGEDDSTQCDIGPYDSSTVDWDPSAPSVTVATGEKAIKALDKMHYAAQVINTMKVPYVGSKVKANSGGLGGLEALLTGENCNATAWTLLELGGVSKKKPSGLHPGWGHKLGKVLSPELAKQLDVPEIVGDGSAGKVRGGVDSSVQVFEDRGGAEKMVTLPGQSDVAIVKAYGDFTQIRFGAGLKAVGYVAKDDVFLPPKPGRKFWVAGSKNSIVNIGGTDGFADAGEPVEVLDDDWMPGQPGMVKIRYTDKWGNTFEGALQSKDLLATNPADQKLLPVPDPRASAPPPEPSGDAGGGARDGFEEISLDDERDPDEDVEVIRTYSTDKSIPMLELNGSPQEIPLLVAQPGRKVGATGRRRANDAGDTMVEFVFEGRTAWVDEDTWEDVFDVPYPNV
jgi:hypothetical protein